MLEQNNSLLQSSTSQGDMTQLHASLCLAIYKKGCTRNAAFLLPILEGRPKPHTPSDTRRTITYAPKSPPKTNYQTPHRLDCRNLHCSIGVRFHVRRVNVEPFSSFLMVTSIGRRKKVKSASRRTYDHSFNIYGLECDLRQAIIVFGNGTCFISPLLASL